MTAKAFDLLRSFPLVFPPVVWIQQPKRHQCNYHLHTWLCTFQRSFRPTYWPNGLNTRQCVTERPCPLNTRTPGRSNYLSHIWKCWWWWWWWWVAHVTARESDICFFQLTHSIHTCGARAYLYTSLYPLPIPCWCWETFSFGYWILSKPNPNMSEERKKWPN